MRRLLLVAAALLSLAAPARAQLVSSPLPTVDASTSATAAAVPAKAAYLGLRENANLVGLVQCDKFSQATISTATTTSLVAVSGSTTIYVCSYTVEIVGVATTAGTLALEQGTGAACVTSPTLITPTWIGSTTAGAPWSVTEGNNIGYLFKTNASAALCALSTTTTVQKVAVRYAQF
jgi:hypothetical protein